jgi:GntR family transcriptional regulator
LALRVTECSLKAAATPVCAVAGLLIHERRTEVGSKMNAFSSSLPIWYQLSQMLRSEILSGKRHPGERLEPEIRMAEQHGISVVPVRQALRALEQEGLIMRRRGSGTFVCEPGDKTASITPLEALFSREFKRAAKIFVLETIETPSALAPYFGNSASMTYFRRLAYRNDMPWSYGSLYVPTTFARELTRRRLSRYPLYRLLREYHNVQIVRSHFEVKAVSASMEVAAHLEIETCSPVLSLMSVGFDKAGKAVGAFEMSFPSEPVVLEFETVHEFI